ncbi:MAG: hypothetical protein Q7V62_02620, partial [Actinomycetota bacterium]|nr:hypothetical protein [Actinomycetota bacterium]
MARDQIDPGHASTELASRGGENVGDRTAFDDASTVDDGNGIGECDDVEQIVGDYQCRTTVLSEYGAQQSSDGRGRVDVERGERFVE